MASFSANRYATNRELFASINCDELLQGRFMNPSESPSFAAMVKRFNTVRTCITVERRENSFKTSLFVMRQTGQWVCCTMLRYDTPADRAKAFEQYIRIGSVCLLDVSLAGVGSRTYLPRSPQECQRIHNFNSFFAIVGGLNTTAVSRLKGSLEKVPKKAMRLYKEIMDLASTDGNFWKYRSVLKKTSLPLIPYLGTLNVQKRTCSLFFSWRSFSQCGYEAICTQDIFKVEEKQTRVHGDMIYFEKMRLLCAYYYSFKVLIFQAFPGSD